MKAARKVLALLPFLLLVVIGVPIAGVAYTEAGKLLGYKTVTVEVVGTGSMYPSLFWDKSEGGPEDSATVGVAEYRSSPHMYRRYPGFKLFGHTFARRTLGYGDMVAFQNKTTESILTKEGREDARAGFIKRIIGLPGDTIELRDGYVRKNGELLDEPYINLPRSTYGGSSLEDCNVLTVPQGEYFVLGDNRKVSSDSRYELGLVKEADISYVLPYAEQSSYRSLWRDTSKDASLLGTPTLDRTEFYNLVNEARSRGNRGKLSASVPLTKSAGLRGAKLLSHKNTTYTLKSALAEVGYSNIALGELVSYGRFSADELLQNMLAFGDTAKQLQNPDYQEIGMTATTKEVDGCPTQVIVVHFGGYLPAEYDQETLVSWRGLRDNLRSVIPSWEKAVGHNEINQEKLTELLTILRRRLTLAEQVVNKMENKDWLSNEEQERIKTDATDAQTADKLAQELNQQ